MKKLLFSLILVWCVNQLHAQDSGYNPYSVRPVHVSYIMWQKTVTRSLDLREKQNLPLFSSNKELVRLIIEAVKAGILESYLSDSLDKGKKLTKDEFMDRLKEASTEAELTEEEKAFQKQQEADQGPGFGDKQVASGPSYYQPNQLYKLEIKEDVLFDRQRSRLYYDIQSITIKVPAELDPKGIENTAGSFKYKDLVDNVFKKNPNAIWFNPINDAEHKNLADAFDLRLFSSRIIKVSNPKDKYLDDIYNESQKQGLMSSTWTEFELMEFEHNLWEF
jgi:gliding motility associated protien GldN